MSKYVVTATWWDVPHLSDDQRQDLLASIPEFQRDARSKGIPQLGSGAVYQIAESRIVVEDFAIPPWWPRGYGMDVGWNCTAAPFGARDPDTGITYIYACHKKGEQRAFQHAQEIAAIDGRIPGAIDPAARGRGQADGTQLYQMYRDLGLDVSIADNTVEAGIEYVRQFLMSGRLKFFKGACSQLLAEYRMYHRDEGKIVKTNDHLLDALRYFVMHFLVNGNVMTCAPREMPADIAAMWEGRQHAIV